MALLCFTGTAFFLGCDPTPMAEARADEPMMAQTIVVTAPASHVRSKASVAPVAPVADVEVSEQSTNVMMPGMESPAEDPLVTLFDPAAPRVVTLTPVGEALAARKGLTTPSMNLFGGVEQPWRVQVGPRFDLGRSNGLMVRGGTQGQHNRWDLGASATVGERSNVQGVVRYHH